MLHQAGRQADSGCQELLGGTRRRCWQHGLRLEPACGRPWAQRCECLHPRMSRSNLRPRATSTACAVCWLHATTLAALPCGCSEQGAAGSARKGAGGGAQGEDDARTAPVLRDQRQCGASAGVRCDGWAVLGRGCRATGPCTTKPADDVAHARRTRLQRQRRQRARPAATWRSRTRGPAGSRTSPTTWVALQRLRPLARLLLMPVCTARTR